MAKHSSSRNPRIKIPEKLSISISDLPDENNNTGFPGMKFPNQPSREKNTWTGSSTSDQEWDESVDLLAPVYLPSRSSLAVTLVDSNLVYKLEEYRNDGSFTTAFFWSLIGALLGVFYDLIKTNSFPLNIQNIAFLIVLGAFTMASGGFSLTFFLRAKTKLKEIKASEMTKD